MSDSTPQATKHPSPLLPKEAPRADAPKVPPVRALSASDPLVQRGKDLLQKKAGYVEESVSDVSDLRHHFPESMKGMSEEMDKLMGSISSDNKESRAPTMRGRILALLSAK